jgi:hypothetical protein
MHRKIYSTVIIISIFISCASGQTSFQRLIGGPLHERAQTILSTYDNQIMINGATGSYGAGDIDAMLIKLDSTGQISWSKTYGTTVYDNAEYTIETGDHNYLCVGRSNVVAGVTTSAIMFKTDSAGNLLWDKTFGGISSDGFLQVIETTDNGFAAVGNTSTLSSGMADILLVRTNSNGDTLFTHAYGTAEFEQGVSLIQLPDSGFLIVGRQITDNGIKSDGIMLRTDASGNQLWTKLFGDSLFDEFSSVKQTNDGGFIVAGSTVSYGAGGFDILLMKTDSAGTPAWTKTFGGGESDAAYDIHITANNEFLLEGFTESLGYGNRMSAPDDANVYLMKTSDAGDFLWMQVYGDGLLDEAYRSALASDGGYLVGGYTNNYLLSDSSQMLIIKTDSMGSSGCHESSEIPVDSLITILFTDTVFSELSGLPTGNLNLSTAVIATNNDDACLFSKVEKEGHSNKLFSVYPNPFSDELNIEIPFENAQLIISDVLGKETLRLGVKNKSVIDTTPLAAGFYTLTVITPENKLTMKIILSR